MQNNTLGHLTFEQLIKRVLPPETDDREHIVYWIHDNSCVRPGWDGYIGVTVRKRARMLEHIRSKKFPEASKIDVIFTGNAEAAYLYEAVLRPHANIGWNMAPGGARGHKLGIPKSEETKKKIGYANTGKIRVDLSKRNSAAASICCCVFCKGESTKSYLYRDHRDCNPLHRKQKRKYTLPINDDM